MLESGETAVAAAVVVFAYWTTTETSTPTCTMHSKNIAYLSNIMHINWNTDINTLIIDLMLDYEHEISLYVCTTYNTPSNLVWNVIEKRN